MGRDGNAKRQTAYSSLTDRNYPTRALTGLPVKARVWFLIVQAGSRAQHFQINTGALTETAEEVAVLLGLRYVFMQTAAEIRLEPSFTLGSRSTLCQGRNGRVTNRLCTSG